MQPTERLAGHPALAEAEIQRLRGLLLQRWQPIETAPKDGTEILLADGGRVTFGKWLAPSEKPRIIYCDDTGYVHSLDGEWRGLCTCPAGKNPTAL